MLGIARFLRLVRLLGATAGKNALRSSLPLYLTVGIGAFVVFAGNGLDARTVTALATAHWLFGLALTMTWVLAALPAARALLASPETYFLRALPVPRGQILAIVCAGLIVAHVPWALLWNRGAGASAALGATSIALAIEVHILAGVRTVVDLTSFAAAAAAFALLPVDAAAFLAGPAFLSGLWRAFVRAPEPPSIGRDAICTRSRALALTSALAVSIYRGHSPVLVRALLFASAACVLAVLGLRNNDIVEAGTIRVVTLLIWGPACLFGAASVAGPALTAESKARWILDACGTSRWLRSASAAGLLGAGAAVLGAAYGGAVGEALGLALGLRALLALETAAGGVAWAVLALSSVRLTRRGQGRDAGRLLLAISGLCVASAALLVTAPALAVGLLLVAAGVLAVVAARAPASG